MEEKICPVCKSTIPLQFVSMESWNQWKRCPSCYKKANIKEGECFFFFTNYFHFNTCNFKGQFSFKAEYHRRLSKY